MKFDRVSLTIFILAVTVHLTYAVHEFLDYLPYSPLVNFVNRKTEFIQNVTLQPTFTPCQVTQDSLFGTCLTKKDCIYIGGTSHFLDRQCGVIGTCCTQINRKWNSTSTLKVSYFTNLGINSNGNALSIQKVKLMNKNVCQLRLDFESFNLKAPTNRETNIENEFYYECEDEYFQVVTDRKKSLGVEYLCGNNTNQHMYVHLYPRNSRGRTFRYPDTVELQIKLASSNSGANWRIKITQLECPELRTSRSLNVEDSFPQENDYYDGYLSPQPQARGGSFYAIDTYDKLLAPPNCLQYFPDSTGIVSSFDFKESDPTTGTYIHGLNYAICFKKGTSNQMRLSFAPYPSFVLGMDIATDPTDCTCDFMNRNFIEIPGRVNSTGITKFCDQYCAMPDIPNTDFEVDTPGPLYIVFNSLHRSIDQYRPGFRMTYKIL